MSEKEFIGERILEQLREYELAVSELYQQFADRVPSMTQFWTQMSRAETGHAQLVQKTMDRVKNGELCFVPGDATVSSLKKGIAALRREIERQEKGLGEITALEALGRGIGIESSLLEDEFYRMAEGESEALGVFKRNMLNSIERHREEMQAMIEEHALQFAKRQTLPREEDRISQDQHCVDELIDHELAMGRIYGLYARQFEEESEFWLGLEKAENMHAAMLRSIRNKLGKEVEADPEKFAHIATELSKDLDFMVKCRQQHSESKPSMAEALRVAYFMELGILEHDYLQLFTGTGEWWDRQLKALIDDTRSHLGAVEDKLTQVTSEP